MPLESATVTACRMRANYTCEPLASGVTDANGDATLAGLILPFPSLAPESGGGYLLIEHASLPKALVFLGAPVFTAGQVVDHGYLFTRDFPITLRVQIDPTRGSIFVHIKDCRGSFPKGATLNDDAGSAGPYYFSLIGFLNVDAGSTDRNGVGLFMNVPTGRSVRIEATLGNSLVAWADVVVEAGTMTSVTLYPYINLP